MKKTKIVATVSDLKCDVNFIKSLIDSGVNVIRLNTAHQTTEATLEVVNNIRKVSSKTAILIDTKGPELRTTSQSDDIFIENGSEVFFEGNPEKESTKSCICVNYSGFVSDINVGSRILLDDGEIEFEVISKDDKCLKTTACNDGKIKSRRTVNVPSVKINLPSLNKRDIEYIDFAVENNIDFIAHSFVRRASDVHAIKEKLAEKNADIKIIAKIENQEGVDNIDEILDLADGVMIARGDLAIEIPAERIPGIQKNIVNKSISLHKPVIIATQMLHSMIEKPRPTRAEISDVANAVYDRTDAIMLSGETAFGKYPVESVKMMVKIAKEVESGIEKLNQIPRHAADNVITAYLAKAAVKASVKLNTEAIILDTLTGRTARAISAYRGKSPIYAECYSEKTMRELSLSYGVSPNFINEEKEQPEFVKNTVKRLLEKGELSKEAMVVIVAGNFGSSRGASYLEIGSVSELI